MSKPNIGQHVDGITTGGNVPLKVRGFYGDYGVIVEVLATVERSDVEYKAGEVFVMDEVNLDWSAIVAAQEPSDFNLGVVQAEPRGVWQADPNGLEEGDGQFTYRSKNGREQITVVTYFGQEDGKPVLQIDGSADFRINVNDGVVFDRSTESNSLLHDVALAMYHEELGLRGRGRYDDYELAKIRAELIDAGYSAAVVDSNGALTEPDPYMWVIVNKQGPDVRHKTALCNELHMQADNVDEAWAVAVEARTIGMKWVTLTKEECLAEGVKCSRCP